MVMIQTIILHTHTYGWHGPSNQFPHAMRLPGSHLPSVRFLPVRAYLSLRVTVRVYS